MTTRTGQYLGVVDDYASTVGHIMNFDTGDNSYQYKHEDSDNRAIENINMKSKVKSDYRHSHQGSH